MMSWLVPKEDRVPTPLLGKAVEPARVIVVHSTVTPCTSRHREEARIKSWMRGERGESSTHFVILRNGCVLQGAGLDTRTWHAGESEWGGSSGVNAFSIGVDLDNVGPLDFANPRGVAYRNVYGGDHGGSVCEVGGELFEPYRVPQLEALAMLIMDIRDALGEELPVTGHRDVSPGRKRDPFASMPDALLQAVAREGMNCWTDWTTWPGVVR